MRGSGALHGMRGWPLKKGEGGSLVVLLLAERARWEGARSTRALEDQPGCPRRRKRADSKGEWRLMIFLCSRTARPRKALVGCAQWRPHQSPLKMATAAALRDQFENSGPILRRWIPTRLSSRLASQWTKMLHG